MKYLSLALAGFVLFSCRPTYRSAEIIDTYLKSQAEHFAFNGTVLVAEGGKVLYQGAFGFADYYTNRPLNDSSLFELASVSKQFTATGILLLRERGLLSLTDSLRMFFPELPYSGITLHHLLTHTSGMPDYESLMESGWNRSRIACNNDVIALMASEKPRVHFAPGTRWEYSNMGYLLLASIIEKVSGTSFAAFMNENIFTPLRMSRSRVYNTRRSGEVIDNYAYGHVWSDSLNRYILPDSLPSYDFVIYMDGIQGDGIINSTAADLLKWDRALADATLVPASVKEEMTAHHALADTLNDRYYGYGLSVGSNEFGEYITHGGGWPGYATNLTRYLDGDRTIIVLSNNESAAGAISGTLARILFDVPVLVAYDHVPAESDRSSLEAFIGKYSVRRSEMEILLDPAGQLQVTVFGDTYGLLPESATKVFVPERIDLQFEREGDTIYRILYGVKEVAEPAGAPVN
jgi:CubicO group peptidase (beta-lactamase class C family)